MIAFSLGFLDFGPGREVRGFVFFEGTDADLGLKLFAAVRSELRSSYWRVSNDIDCVEKRKREREFGGLEWVGR